MHKDWQALFQRAARINWNETDAIRAWFNRLEAGTISGLIPLK
jgi:hypothetical protein